MIQIDHLKKSYGDACVFSDLSLTFRAHEVVSIVGPSGCGKSTLLRCINGLETFEGGEVRVGTETLRATARGSEHRHALRAIRQKVGFVFQQFNLFAHRTALGNVVEAPMHVKKMPRGEAEERGRAGLERVGLAHRAMAYPHEMSGGEQQRVAIARALAMSPDVLLLDEPTSSLDPARKAEVWAVLRRLAEDGMTMILVTHEMDFAREVSHRVVALRDGAVDEDGRPADVLAHLFG